MFCPGGGSAGTPAWVVCPVAGSPAMGCISNVMPANGKVAMAMTNRRDNMDLRGLRFAIVACVLLRASTPAALGTASGGVVSWGTQALPPFDNATRFIAVSGGGIHTPALKADGTVAVWGDNCCGQATPPAGLSNV